MPDHVKEMKENIPGRRNNQIKDPEARKKLGLFKKITGVHMAENGREVSGCRIIYSNAQNVD